MEYEHEPINYGSIILINITLFFKHMELIKILEGFLCMTYISFCILQCNIIFFNCFSMSTYYFLSSRHFLGKCSRFGYF